MRAYILWRELNPIICHILYQLNFDMCWNIRIFNYHWTQLFLITDPDLYPVSVVDSVIMFCYISLCLRLLCYCYCPVNEQGM